MSNIKFDHIGRDTAYHCQNCGHHHCLECKTCHRCGCTNWKINRKERKATREKAKMKRLKEVDNKESRKD